MLRERFSAPCWKPPPLPRSEFSNRLKILTLELTLNDHTSFEIQQRLRRAQQFRNNLLASLVSRSFTVASDVLLAIEIIQR